MTSILSGTYKGQAYRIKAECHHKTAQIKITLLSVNGHGDIPITQNLGQAMPPYQAFLSDGLLELCDSGFMEFMEANGLGYIAEYKRYDFNVFSGGFRKIAAVFQFDKAVLQKFDPIGCAGYEKHYDKRLPRPEKRRDNRVACTL